MRQCVGALKYFVTHVEQAACLRLLGATLNKRQSGRVVVVPTQDGNLFGKAF